MGQIRKGFDCVTDSIRIEKSATRTTGGLRRNTAVSAVTRQAMDTLETCAVMTVSSIGRIDESTRFLTIFQTALIFGPFFRPIRWLNAREMRERENAKRICARSADLHFQIYTQGFTQKIKFQIFN